MPLPLPLPLLLLLLPIKGLCFSLLFAIAHFLCSYPSLFNNSFPYQTDHMGCCPSHPYNPTPPPFNSATNRSPPLPPQDDIKEVLTERQPLPSRIPVFDPNNLVKDRTFRHPKQLATIKDSKSRVPSAFPLDDTSEDRASEICCRSESFVSTADDNSSSGALLRAVASKNEGRRSSSSRSPAKKQPGRTQSPVSAASSASARRNVRRMQDQSPGRRVTTKVVGGPKADLGERSGRRSRSPVTRVGRTESGRRTDPSSSGRSRRQNTNREELIENPLVSLECFIFL